MTTITDLTTWVVNVPFRSTFVSSFEALPGLTRTVLRLRTDDGLEGWGETMSGHPVADLIERLAPDVVGHSPFDLEAMHQRLTMVPFFYGYHGYAAIAGLDVACWDLIGKATGQPLVNLIGGPVRDLVPRTSHVTRGHVDTTAPGDLPAALAEHAAHEVDALQFAAIKLKGTHDVDGDLDILTAIRERLPSVNLRVDPNAGWTVHQTMSAGSRLETLGLEYLEDPCPGLEGMRRVRRHVRIPLCTNMCVVRFEDVAPAVRMDAVDVIHGDVFKWGGVSPTKHLASHCDSFGLSMNMHSSELGLSTAVNVAIAASTPQVRHSIDSMYYLLADDILTEPLPVVNGSFAVRLDRPGIGVQVDPDKLSRFAQAHAEEGGYRP